MAEFCLDCVNKCLFEGEEQLKERDVILSDDWCEGCKKRKPCVVVIKPKNFHEWIRRKLSITEYIFRCLMRYIKDKYAKTNLDKTDKI